MTDAYIHIYIINRLYIRIETIIFYTFENEFSISIHSNHFGLETAKFESEWIHT